MPIHNLDKIHEDSFGLWLSGLFSAIEGNNNGLPFPDQRVAFFEILELWLDEDKIRFCKPSDPLGEPWEAPSSEIMDYLKSHWPTQANDEADPALNLYFYEMPAILWVGRDGKLYGS